MELVTPLAGAQNDYEAGRSDPDPPSRAQKLVHEAIALLQQAVDQYQDVAYPNSLGLEAMVLMDLICYHVPGIDIFTIDTGRLHCESLFLLDRLERHFQHRIRIVSPDADALEAHVRENGVCGFYSSLERRRSCCEVRKVAPFARAIDGRKAWVTGVRREQSRERARGKPLSWDARYGLWKVSPLLDWTDADIWAHVRARNLPYNTLHDKGYTSIGCAPCTRAVEPGADPRSGRWWWESADKRECGIQPPVADDIT
jgi:phosphoadenosine phosphosulfate reductase